MNIPKLVITAELSENGRKIVKAFRADTDEEANAAAFDIITSLFVSGDLNPPLLTEYDRYSRYGVAVHATRTEAYLNALRVMNGTVAAREVLGKRFEMSPFHVLGQLPQYDETIKTSFMWSWDMDDLCEPNSASFRERLSAV